MKEGVVLDACALVPSLLCDILLRLAEEGLFLPRWSDVILDEVGRSQVRIGFPEPYANSWRRAVESTFPEATVQGYEAYLDRCDNHPKDRHVLASAIVSSASRIVTFNLRDFPPSSLAPWFVLASHPDSFLNELYEKEPQKVEEIVSSMALKRAVPPVDMLRQMRKVVPTFAKGIARDLGLTLA